MAKLLEITEGAAHKTTGQQGSQEKAENVKDNSRKIKKEITSLNDNEKQEVALFLEQLKIEEERDAKLGEFLHGRLAQVERGDFSNKTVTDIWTQFRSMV